MGKKIIEHYYDVIEVDENDEIKEHLKLFSDKAEAEKYISKHSDLNLEILDLEVEKTYSRW